jgi:hypothetical protein
MSAPSRNDFLPEPTNAFARWFGRATIGAAALGVQSLPTPWSQLGAILSPGIGYIVGYALQSILEFTGKRISSRERRLQLQGISDTIINLQFELEDARRRGATGEVILHIEKTIDSVQMNKIKILTLPADPKLSVDPRLRPPTNSRRSSRK